MFRYLTLTLSGACFSIFFELARKNFRIFSWGAGSGTVFYQVAYESGLSQLKGAFEGIKIELCVCVCVKKRIHGTRLMAPITSSVWKRTNRNQSYAPRMLAGCESPVPYS